MKTWLWAMILGLCIVGGKQTEATGLTDRERDFLESIQHGDMKEFQKLMKKGISANVTDNGGNSALVLAVYYKRSEMVQQLLQAGADAKATFGDEKMSSVMLAVVQDVPEIAEMLVQAGADVTGKDKGGLNALWWACQDGYSGLAVALIRAGADVTVVDEKNRYTPLMLGSVKGDAVVARALVEAGADLNARDRNGYTALLWAAQEGKTEVVQILLGAGADAKLANRKQYTPLHVSAMEGHLDIVNALLAKEVDVNAKEIQGVTPLMFAAQEGFLEVVRALIQAKADVNAVANDMRNTALHVSAAKGHTAVVESLIQAGAKVNAKNLIGYTPLKLANEYKHTETADVLRKAGGKE